MTDFKATPGPWRIKYGRRHSLGECDIAIYGDMFLLTKITGPAYPHCEQNARLMVAAPELYGALREAAEWLPYHEPNHPDYEGEISDVGRRARDVLAKARGDGDE